MSNVSYELPPTDEVTIDGYKIDLSTGILVGQTLIYDGYIISAGTAAGTINGSITPPQVAYSNGSSTITGSNNFIFDDAYNVLKVYGDGYVSQRMIINGSTAAVSASGTGAFRFNSGTSHLEFSENGGGWSAIGSGSVAIGSPITSATNNRILYADGSGNLNDTLLSLTSSELGPVSDNTISLGDNSHRFVDGYFTGKIKLDGYTIDLSAGATTNQVLTYNGTSFVAANATGGITGTLTNTKVPYATGTSTIADSTMAWDSTNQILTITTLAGNDGVAVTDGTRSLGLFVNYNSAAVGALGTTSNHNLVFFTNNQAAQMTLNTSGNLGIGASPSYKLDVNGDIHISANRLLIDASSAGLSPSGMGAIRFNTSTNHLEFSENGGSYTQFGGGGGGGAGTSGQFFINIIPIGFSQTNNSASSFVVGAIVLNPGNYTLTSTTMSAVFRVVAANGNNTVTGHAKLRDVSTAQDITTLNITAGTNNDTLFEQALSFGTPGSNTISSSQKTYEVSIYVDSPTLPTDFIQLYSAELRIINTIN